MTHHKGSLKRGPAPLTASQFVTDIHETDFYVAWTFLEIARLDGCTKTFAKLFVCEFRSYARFSHISSFRANGVYA